MDEVWIVIEIAEYGDIVSVKSVWTSEEAAEDAVCLARMNNKHVDTRFQVSHKYVY